MPLFKTFLSRLYFLLLSLRQSLSSYFRLFSHIIVTDVVACVVCQQRFIKKLNDHSYDSYWAELSFLGAV